MSLTRSHQQLLKLLAKRPIATHESLYDALYWQRSSGEKPDPKVIHTFIWELRQRLPPGSIEKVWGVGYRMNRDALGKE